MTDPDGRGNPGFKRGGWKERAELLLRFGWLILEFIRQLS